MKFIKQLHYHTNIISKNLTKLYMHFNEKKRPFDSSIVIIIALRRIGYVEQVVFKTKFRQ